MMKRAILPMIFFIGSIARAGFDFAPIISNLAPSGQGATTSFTVTNAEPTKLAVQVTIVPREPDINGKEEYKESDKIDETFRIFPSQLVLEPKESRTVRVTYIGNSQVTSELAYRIIAEELPVDLDDPSKVYTKAVAKITISSRYIGSLYVTPKTAKSEIVVEAKQSETASTNLILDITNKGTAHQVYRKPIVKVFSKATGKEIQLAEDDIKPLMSQNVLAGRTRRFNLPWPKALAPGPVKVTLDVTKE
ncbi:MAG: fimbrial biogenesis chaperone [Pseudobdellovibrionaceae bacterium]